MPFLVNALNIKKNGQLNLNLREKLTYLEINSVLELFQLCNFSSVHRQAASSIAVTALVS